MDKTDAMALPQITEDGKPFWGACNRREFQLQFCTSCRRFQFPPRSLCSHCLSTDLEERTVDGKGAVYSFTVVWRAPEPAFQQAVPYVLALVDLDVGPRIMSNIIGCAPEQVKIGMRVEPVFVDINEEVTLIKFQPVS